MAAELILDMIERQRPVHDVDDVVVTPRLVVRQSTAAPCRRARWHRHARRSRRRWRSDESRDHAAAGCDREYLGIEPRRAWERTVEVAREAERSASSRSGCTTTCRSIHRRRRPRLRTVRRASALAMATTQCPPRTSRARGAYRPAGLTAKMIGTLDVVSGGRAELGIGAGWKRDEWESYGYGFPDASERLAILADHLEIITRMLQPGAGDLRGNGTPRSAAPCTSRRSAAAPDPGGRRRQRPNVTWRLAARFADELNLDAMPPADVERALPVIRSRCEEIGRDPRRCASRSTSGVPADAPAGPARRERLRGVRRPRVGAGHRPGFAAVRDPGHLDRRR